MELVARASLALLALLLVCSPFVGAHDDHGGRGRRCRGSVVCAGQGGLGDWTHTPSHRGTQMRIQSSRVAGVALIAAAMYVYERYCILPPIF